jgi:hypothetical protein
MDASRRNPQRRHSFSRKRALSAAVGVFVLLGAATSDAATITSPTTGSATVGIAYTYQITSDITGGGITYTASPLPPGSPAFTVSSTGLISGTPTTVGTTVITLTAKKGATTATGTLTLTVVAEYRITVKYDWSAQSSTSYLGNATQFLTGTSKAWGQIFVPPVPATPLYFKNNKPGYGVASIDVLVQSGRQAGQCTGTSTAPTCTVYCYADWLPPNVPPSGTTVTLTVTLFDPKGAVSSVTQTKTIIPGTCFSQPTPCTAPSTLVETITYTVIGTNGSMTLSP